jgi:hypothetical protein
VDPEARVVDRARAVARLVDRPEVARIVARAAVARVVATMEIRATLATLATQAGRDHQAQARNSATKRSAERADRPAGQVEWAARADLRAGQAGQAGQADRRVARVGRRAAQVEWVARPVGRAAVVPEVADLRAVLVDHPAGPVEWVVPRAVPAAQAEWAARRVVPAADAPEAQAVLADLVDPAAARAGPARGFDTRKRRTERCASFHRQRYLRFECQLGFRRRRLSAVLALIRQNIRQGSESSGQLLQVRARHRSERVDKAGLNRIRRLPQQRASRGRQRDRKPPSIATSCCSSHEFALDKARYDHRHGALMSERPLREIVDRHCRAIVELVEDVELSAAEADSLLGLAAGDSKRLDDRSDRIHNVHHVGPCLAADHVSFGLLSGHKKRGRGLP